MVVLRAISLYRTMPQFPALFQAICIANESPKDFVGIERKKLETDDRNNITIYPESL